jgi:hypothetical protein
MTTIVDMRWVLAAQSAVFDNLPRRYALTLTTPAILTTPFIVWQASVDKDLGALWTAGVIDAYGMQNPAAASLLLAAGLAYPLTAPPTPSSGTRGTNSAAGDMM